MIFRWTTCFLLVDSAFDREGTNISSKYNDMYAIALVCFDTAAVCILISRK